MRFVLATLCALSCVDCASTPPRAVEAINGHAESVVYRGRAALRLDPLAGHEQDDGSMLGFLAEAPFRDGTIELDVAGSPRAGASPLMKGFIGVMFRVERATGAGEIIYLRPSNGRSSSQLERNHSAQYSSSPDFGWRRLRNESPGVYESYVDLEPGAWTHMKIEVAGTRARLFVGGAAQPCLVVDDLKRGDGEGAVALWAHQTTVAYFANPKVTPSRVGR